MRSRRGGPEGRSRGRPEIRIPDFIPDSILRLLASAFRGPPSAPAHPAAIAASDRLGLAIFLAAVTHLLIVLGVTFAPHEPGRRVQRSLDVLLVQERSRSPPEDAHFISEADQRGADEAPRPADPPASPPDAAANAVRASIEAVPAPLSAVPASQPAETLRPANPPDAFVAQSEVPRQHEALALPRRPALPGAEEPPGPHAPQRAPAGAAVQVQAVAGSDASRRARVMEELSAEIDARLAAYEKRPRQKWISARTREHAYAAYMDAWRRKVERIGNLSYPPEARRRGLSGSLSLDVALNADGSVAEVLLRRSSGEKVLDEAAERIVRLAAPFAAFPPSIREEVDVLHIERTWQFSSGHRIETR